MKSPAQQRTILVVSDLHFTTGRDPASGRWAPTEDFFWDEEFREFLTFYARRGPCTLVLNGDWLDFMQVTSLPTADERVAYGIPDQDLSRLYGLRCSAPVAAYQVDKIIDGHPVFFRALAGFLASGHELKVLKGNHDIQLFWPEVQERILRRLCELAPATKRRVVAGAVEFLPWVYYVPGLLYVEHGNQLEESCAFRNFLTPRLPARPRGVSRYIELDLSGLLVRYLTNRVEPENPLADNVRPLSDFYVMLAKKDPLFALRIFGTALRYVLKACAKATRLRTGRARAEWRRIHRENDEAIAGEARRFTAAKPNEEARLATSLRRLYDVTPTPILEQGPARFLRSVLRRPMLLALWLVPLYLLTYLPAVTRWLLGCIDSADIPAAAAVADTLDALNLLSFGLLVAFGLLVVVVLRLLPRRRRRTVGSSTFPDVSMVLREYAGTVSRELGVPFVTFGHTHYADTAPLPGGGRYFNTGTWMGIVASREQLYRELHQFTYLAVAAGKGELLHWNADRSEPQPVIVMDLNL